MARYPWVLLWCFAAFLFLEAYSLFKTEQETHKIAPFVVSGEEVKMFLVSPVRISFQTWVDYACRIVAVCILLDQLRRNIPQYAKQLQIFLFIGFGYLIDYFVMYNDPIMRIGFIPISYTLFAIFVLMFVVWRSFYKSWK